MKLDEVLKLPLVDESIDSIREFLNENEENIVEHFMAKLFLSSLLFNLHKDSEGMKNFLEAYNDRTIKKYEECYLYSLDVIIEYYIKRRQFKEARDFIEEKKTLIPQDKRYLWKLDYIKIYLLLERFNDAKNHLLDINGSVLLDHYFFDYYLSLIKVLIEFEEYDDALKNIKRVKEMAMVENNNEAYNRAYLDELNIKYLKEDYSNIKESIDDIIAYENEISDDLVNEAYILNLKVLLKEDNIKKASIYGTEYEEDILRSDNPIIKRDFFSLMLEISNKANDSYSKLYYEDKLSDIKALIDRQNSMFVDKKPKVKVSRKKEIEEIPVSKEVSVPILKKELISHKNPSFDEVYKTVTFMEEVMNITFMESNEDLRESYRQIMMKLSNYALFDESVLSILNEDKLILIYYKKNLAYDYIKDPDYLDETIMGNTIIMAEEQIYSSFDELENTKEIIHQKSAKSLGIGSMMCFPLIRDNEAYGAISFYGPDLMITKEFNYEILRYFSKLYEYSLLFSDRLNEIRDKTIRYQKMYKESLAMLKMSLNDLVYINPSLSDLIHLPKKINYTDYYARIDKDYVVKYRRAIENLQNEKQDRTYIEYKINGHYVKETIKRAMMDGKMVLLSNIDVIDEIKELKEKKIEEATFDYLTGLKLRKLAVERIEKLVPTNKFSLLLLDIDNFKAYNDIYGHDFGDLVLKTLAKLLKNKYGDEFYRLESDQILFIIEDVNDMRKMSKIALEMIKYLELNMERENSRFKLKYSIGLLRYPIQTREKNPDKIIKFVDLANYIAKRKKTNLESSYAFYDNKTYHDECFEQVLITHVSEAIDKHLLQVKYQQVIDIRNNRVLHYEGRAHIINYSVSDDYVFDVSYKRGIIENLDRYSIKSVLHEVKEIFNKTGKYIRVSIPICDKTFLNDSFEGFLESELNKLLLNPNVLILEVVKKEKNDLIIEKLRRIKKLGVSIVITLIEDVVKINADYLKIGDISKYIGDSYALLAINNIVDMAKKMQIKLIVSNVDNKESLDMLKNSNVEYIKGKCYGRRMIKDEILEKLLKSNKVKD